AERVDAFLHTLSQKCDPPRSHLACFGTWILYYTLRIISMYLLAGFELELYSVHEYYYIYWYLYEFLYAWLISALTRADNFLVEQEMLNEVQSAAAQHGAGAVQTGGKRAAGGGKKSKGKSRKKSRAATREIVMYQALQNMCGGYFKALLGFESDGKLPPPPHSEFSSERVRYEHRFAPLSTLVTPPHVQYEEFVDSVAHLATGKSSYPGSNLALLGFESDGKLPPPPHSEFSSERVRYEHRFAPLSTLVTPPHVQYEEFVDSVAHLATERVDAFLHTLSQKCDPPRSHLACFGTWILYYTLRIISMYLLAGFELELYSVHEYYYIYWYLYEFLYAWLISALTRADNFLVEQEMLNEVQSAAAQHGAGAVQTGGKRAAGGGKKSKGKSRKKSRAATREIVMYQALQNMCGGYFKVLDLIRIMKTNFIVVKLFATRGVNKADTPASRPVQFDFSVHACYPMFKL
ncbi:uncharacterized protein LOC103520226, partial [Diaphorina citri]|uniref:Protein MAK10 homolog n=1 Tax=Diaphorina citri TaxID=121845 RepID=A0A1S4EP20_DIACI